MEPSGVHAIGLLQELFITTVQSTYRSIVHYYVSMAGGPLHTVHVSLFRVPFLAGGGRLIRQPQTPHQGGAGVHVCTLHSTLQYM